MSKERKHAQAMVYPVAGRLIRDPDTRLKLSPAGENKPMNSYWVRKIQDGDVTTEAPSSAPAQAEPALMHAEEAAPQSYKKKGKE